MTYQSGNTTYVIDIATGGVTQGDPNTDVILKPVKKHKTFIKTINEFKKNHTNIYSFDPKQDVSNQMLYQNFTFDKLKVSDTPNVIKARKKQERLDKRLREKKYKKNIKEQKKLQKRIEKACDRLPQWLQYELVFYWYKAYSETYQDYHNYTIKQLEKNVWMNTWFYIHKKVPTNKDNQFNCFRKLGKKNKIFLQQPNIKYAWEYLANKLKT